ncbi:hypothetical protein GCM10027089_32110 [Nocardia thraciensis]
MFAATPMNPYSQLFAHYPETAGDTALLGGGTGELTVTAVIRGFAGPPVSDYCLVISGSASALLDNDGAVSEILPAYPRPHQNSTAFAKQS